jgi:FixJ family two-component response regulator
MQSKGLLILGSHRSQEYVEALANIGFVPEVWGSVRHSLDKVRRRRLSGVVVDRKFTHADVLEFILNVRDINRTIPVVVIGSGKNKRIEGKISKQDRTVVLSESDRGQELAKELAHAIGGGASENV